MTNVLTVEELADELRCGKNAAYRLVAEGHIFSRRIGRSIRIPRRALEAFLNPETEMPAPAIATPGAGDQPAAIDADRHNPTHGDHHRATDPAV